MEQVAALMTPKQAARWLGSSELTLSKWRHFRRGPAYLKIGWKIRYSLTDLENFVNASRVVPSEQVRIRQTSQRSKRSGR
jgi:hypothetical protein